MFGLAPDYTPLLAALAGLIVWYRCFWREGKFSLLSLLVLITATAVWIGFLFPRQFGFWM
ncbi:hypothetical protein [Anatilimnocola floriformis]|uniref:hypothetical protein n=1 Tax=Anatilimnocola floriformis TaxID=2948575 RepID=UPI0020C4D70D|nr:hypothetical protein [Anatilimnocola floriformis]